MFKPGVWLTGFVAVFLPLFVALGMWQLNRAEQKTQIEARMEAGRSQVESLPVSGDLTAYQHYRVPGRLVPDRLWLLDNRTHQGRVGYEVWVPLVTDHGWFLASLGWVEGTGRRDRLPDVRVPRGERRWRAESRPLTDAIVLEETPLSDTWPQVVQRIQPAAMAQVMEREPPRGLLQLTANQPGVGPVIWTPAVMSAQQHRGYAVQWFAMALALLGMYGYAGWRRAGPDSARDS